MNNNNTKNKIKTAFLDLYKEKNIEKISIKEITNAANIYRGTFYYYFDDIYFLLNELENDFFDEVKSFAPKIFDFINSNDVDSFSKFLDDFFAKNESIIDLFLIKKPNPNLIKKAKEFAKSLVLKNFGICDDSLSLEQEFLLEYIASASLSMWVMWIENNRNIKSNDLIKLLRKTNLKIFNDIFPNK